ncbi:MAG: EAL domain-containing protein [Pseudomonadota bacterium]
MSFFSQRRGLIYSVGPHFFIWLLVTLLLGAGWQLTSHLIDESRVQTLASTESDLINLGRVSQEHAERTFISADQTIRLVRGQYLEHGDQLDLKSMAEQGLVDDRILVQVGLINAHGILQLSSVPFSGRIDLSDREHFKAHLKGGSDALFISRPVLGRASGKWSIQLSRRITLKNGDFGGVVVVSLDPTYFIRFYKELELGKQAVGAIFGLDGTVIAMRIGDQEKFGGDLSPSPALLRIVKGEKTTMLTYRSITDGIERIHHFRKLPSYPLVVAIGMASQDVFADHELKRSQLLWQTAIASFLLLSLGGFASWRVVTGRRVSAAQQRSLAQLQSITSRAPGVLFRYVLRPDGRASFSFVSKGIRKLYRLGPDEFAQDNSRVFSLIHPDDVAGVSVSLQASARTLMPWGHEFRVRFEDGTVRWHSGKATAQQLADGTVVWHGFVFDATEHKQAQQSLITLSAAVEQSPVSIVITDPQGLILSVNPMFEQVSGYTRAEVLGRHAGFLASGEISKNAESSMWGTLAAGEVWNGEFHNRRKDGSLFWEQAAISPIFDERGEIIHYIGIKEDITERKRTESQLRIAAIAFESEEGMFITDANGVILRINQAFSRITGYSAADAIGKKPGMLRSGRHDAAFYAAMRESIEQTGSWQGEIWNRRKNGEIYPEWLSITAVKDDLQKLSHYVSTLADITKRKAAEAEIQYLAFYDPLTGLPNRRLLSDRLNQALAGLSRSQRCGALLFLDLDNFKILNDTHGHDQGDLLLKQVAERLRDCVREGDTVARLGGDEFVVMLQDLSGSLRDAAAQAEAVGEKMLAVLRQPYKFHQSTHYSSASMGVTLFSEGGDSVDDLLKRADLALYKAKDAGRNTLRFFDPDMQAAMTERSELEADLRQGLQDNQFLLYYQPQVDELGRLMGVEALARWQHPRRGLVSPAHFIPLAEDTRLILPLGQWVLETACRQLQQWATQPHTAHLTMAVNVSALQFYRENFVQEVLETIDRTGAPASRLKLELTESMLVKDVDDIIAKMMALKTRGVGFSLDDFGTGYSSLSYLKRLPLDQLKIDQSFLHEALSNPKDAALVRATVTLGQSMGMMVIAEGVETQPQRDFLESEGCFNYQGYYFGHPAPVAALERFFQPD